MLIRYIIFQVSAIIHAQPRQLKQGLWVIALCTALVGFMELGVAGLVSLLGVGLTSPQSVLQFAPIQALLEINPTWAETMRDPRKLLSFLLACVALGICCKNLLQGFLVYWQNLYSQKLATQTGISLFQTYMHKPYVWHTQQNAAELSAIIELRIYIANFLSSFFILTTQILIVCFLLAGGIVVSASSTAIVFGMTGIAGIAIYKVSRKKIHATAEYIIQEQMEARKLILAGCQGIAEIQVYGCEDAISQRVRRHLHKTIKPLGKVSTAPMLPAWILESVGIMTVWIALGWMSFASYSLTRSTAILTLLVAIAWRLLPCMNKCITAIVTIQTTRPYLEKFFDETILGVDVLAKCKTENATSFTRNIRIQNISFRYPESVHDALHDITLDIPKGHMIGVIGSSGAGKSTLIGILTNLLTPHSGHIQIDGITLENGLSGLRPLIGYVPQSPYLIDSTLAENIAFSRLGEPIDEQKLLRVCNMAALDFWEQLPQGVHTELGERGIKLSGGQIQRVAIARALYAEPQLLIFDEATSALDNVTENAIQKTILELRECTTMVIIAHRLSTLNRCDRIYRMENGRIVDFGSPKDILPRMQG